MRFYYENHSGDCGYFSENNIVKAIYTAWNIEADLYMLNDGVKKLDPNDYACNQMRIVFAPYETNEFNTDCLKEFGYYMEDGEMYREIKEILTGKVVRYDWAEVRQLI